MDTSGFQRLVRIVLPERAGEDRGGISIQRLVRTVLLIVFLISLAAGSAGFYLLLRRQAVEGAEQQARLLLAAAMGVRGYTDARILPEFAHLPASTFHEETVPSFAAQESLKNISVDGATYTYREPALNPTAAADRATPFEVEMIRRLAADNSLTEITGTFAPEGQKLFYLARPIRITDANCLVCHDTPARAPAAMIAKYGSGNGFGWQMGQTVAMQILTVPVAQQFHNTLQLVALLALGLLLIFFVAYLALATSLERMVAQPLHRLAEAADAASRSADAGQPLAERGVDEIRTAAAAIERLRISLGKSLRALRGE